MNAAAEEATGWGWQDAAGKPAAGVFRVIRDDSGAPLENPVEQPRLRTCEKAVQESACSLIDIRGRRLPIEWSVSPVRDASGAFGGAVLVFRDVASRRATERALQSSEESRAEDAAARFEEKERAQVTLNSIGDAVVSTNFWGRVTYLNIVAERMTGWSQAQAQGRGVDDVFRLVHVATRNRFRAPPPEPSSRTARSASAPTACWFAATMPSSPWRPRPRRSTIGSAESSERSW